MSVEQLNFPKALGKVGIKVHDLNVRRSSPMTTERIQQSYRGLSAYPDAGASKIAPVANEP